MKKYFIRVIGALCILGAAALMFLSAWLELDGVEKRDLRNVREDVTGIINTVSSYYQASLDMDDFKDDLKDNDLPYKRTEVKKYFKELDGLTKELLDSSVSMKELLVLSAKTPGVVKDLENTLELYAADEIFYRAAEYALWLGNDPMIDATWEDVKIAADNMQQMAEDAVDEIDGIPLICYGLVAVLGLVLTLAAASAVTHVCNKLRWLKYLFFAVLLLLVVGSMVAIPMVNELLAEAMFNTPVLEDVELKVTATPILAVALMFVPIVLDIIFEKKNKQIKMEV